MKVRTNIKVTGLALLITAAITLSGCAASDVTNLAGNGSAVSTMSHKLTPINSNKVRLFYSGSEYPKHYKVVGRISAENYSIIGTEHSQETIAEELKRQAASIGANVVININSGLAQTTGDAVFTSK